MYCNNYEYYSNTGKQPGLSDCQLYQQRRSERLSLEYKKKELIQTRDKMKAFIKANTVSLKDAIDSVTKLSPDSA